MVPGLLTELRSCLAGEWLAGLLGKETLCLGLLTGCAEKKISLLEKMAPQTMAARIQMPAWAMGAVPVYLVNSCRPSHTNSVASHTNPQVVIQRLALHLTCIASSAEERLFLALAARGSGIRGDSGRRSHFEARRMKNSVTAILAYDSGREERKNQCQRATGTRGKRRTLEHVSTSCRTMTTPASLHESTNQRGLVVR